ncbi:RTA1-domain-containing protein [Gloeophyllum trabeum ATCC 11539]|uniref:RTA1-domain-containing protein n=1 Tax=Gloeophyllum trabeum (strain ATCC 11539 / FP-39264 / Madison 617) TaxID=670483 RepID=S7S124_GLOTA|nr:RTA1-domain-containing protein [Gloeophyllum trabeum ATCC 11539]EPQ59429.1 RTA1-domain-containing protein [Gloeophyllum trabeum ATCC 11539]
MLSRYISSSARRTAVLCLLAAVFLASSDTLAAARDVSVPRPADPFADPRHDPYNPLRYIASNTLTAIAFTLVLVVAFIQSFSMWKWGAVWMLSMVIGEYTWAMGFGCRFGLHSHPESRGIYIAEYLLIVLSPCAFIAADYVLLGRLARYLKCEQHLLIPPNRITIFFVCSDIVTFLIQAAGGSISISNNPQTALTGSHIFLAGLAAQFVSFLFFSLLYCAFLWKIYRHNPEVYSLDKDKKWYHDWRTLGVALFISCIGILIRSIYRTIELSEGYQGHLATSEPYFYGLDTLPLFIAITVYVPFWPGRFIPPLAPPVRKELVGDERSSAEQQEKDSVQA